MHTIKKEYVYGLLVVVDDILYFSDKLTDDDNVMLSPVVSTIYNSLSSNDMILYNDNYIKEIDDSNIDYVIDTMLTVFPPVSQKYIDIISKY
jgi:23S rRNA maturation-related 3'-5' exoribonuclease YhaM